MNNKVIALQKFPKYSRWVYVTIQILEPFFFPLLLQHHSNLKERGSLHRSRLVDSKAKRSGNISLRCLLWLQVAICHQKQMRKCCAKVSSINV